ncbi:hypothetical protein SDC9_202578 [bioreactor metagenome]|uniref:Uncharacterized protein n=1 Tax=bioreactor metagenome TaxID=1076179 RepID=A0A645IVJ1_9ZZZZ
MTVIFPHQRGFATLGGQEHLFQKALRVHITAGLAQPLRRAHMRLEKVVVQMEHVCVKQAAKMGCHRGFPRAAVTIDGEENAFLRLQQRVHTSGEFRIGFAEKNGLCFV